VALYEREEKNHLKNSPRGIFKTIRRHKNSLPTTGAATFFPFEDTVFHNHNYSFKLLQSKRLFYSTATSHYPSPALMRMRLLSTLSAEFHQESPAPELRSSVAVVRLH